MVCNISKKMHGILNTWGNDFDRQIRFRLWPDFKHGSFYLDLLSMSESALENPCDFSSIGALFVYQQLAEEILLAIDYWCHYRQMLEDYPAHSAYELPDRLMFGQLIQRLKDGADFPRKNEVISLADTLNKKCRIPAAHKLLYNDNLKNCRVLACEAKTAVEKIIDHLDHIQEHMLSTFSQLADKLGIPNERPGS